jgi:quinol monooxygenase YgiN
VRRRDTDGDAWRGTAPFGTLADHSKTEEDDMPSIVATIQVKADKIEEAKGFLKGLAAGVLADEPGTLAYVCHQRKDDPTRFVIYEKYASDEAFAVHGKNLAVKGKEFASILAGAPEIVMLQEV